jgi:hypothetical protein
LELRQDALKIVGGMLPIDQKPIEARARTDFCRDRIGQSHPKANLRAFLLEGDFERIDGCLHAVVMVGLKWMAPWARAPR